MLAISADWLGNSSKVLAAAEWRDTAPLSCGPFCAETLGWG